ncbi:uncharacterized protein Dmul_00500 [Desulfococcus multivorans]|nr:uncharacterized protein Dmul_00500 [Desulfococcus multivorans]
MLHFFSFLDTIRIPGPGATRGRGGRILHGDPYRRSETARAAGLDIGRRSDEGRRTHKFTGRHQIPAQLGRLQRNSLNSRLTWSNFHTSRIRKTGSQYFEKACFIDTTHGWEMGYRMGRVSEFFPRVRKNLSPEEFPIHFRRS